MRVQSTRRINEKIGELYQIKNSSSIVNSILTNTITLNSIIPKDLEILKKEATEIKKEMDKNGDNSYSVDKIIMLLMVEGIISPYLHEQVLDFYMNWIASESKVYDVNEFNENPYIKNINFRDEVKGDYELKYMTTMPYELQLYDAPKRLDQVHVDIPRLCCFPEKFEYPVIFQKSIGSTWMSVSPNEVTTVAPAIKNAKGKVITLGCGMGYFAYMASLKEDVESITIIELEQSVIDLFEEFILPQFENKNKIKVIKADAIEYMKNVNDGDFDYCFADIWIGIMDVEPYLGVKRICKKFHKMKIDYWIEESFSILFTSYVWIEILQDFMDANDMEVPPMDMQILNNEKRLKDYIHKLLEDVSITKPEHIDYYLNPKNIINLINCTDIKF